MVGHHAGVSVQGKKKKKRSSIPWIWGPAQQCAFDTLEEKLSSPPVLAYADFSKPFILHTDASIEGLGAVLYQEHDGLEKVIAWQQGFAQSRTELSSPETGISMSQMGCHRQVP